MAGKAGEITITKGFHLLNFLGMFPAGGQFLK
jgi:hypothetical protein